MYSPQYPTAFFTSWASSIRGSLLAWFTSSISTAPETDHIIRHSILTSRPETTASWTLNTDGLRCNAGDQKDWKKLRAPSSPFNEQRKAAPISQENSRIPRGWLIRKARHWRAFLRVLGTFPLSAGLLGLGGRIRTLRWWIGI